MSLLLVLFYLSCAQGSPHGPVPYPGHTSILAGTTGIPPQSESGADAVSLAQDTRSVLSIVWSCLATIFACTWASIHPNVPHPDATEWQIRKHRALLMFSALIAPELIVLWAMRQWFGARESLKALKRYNAGVTITHTHFLQMGGFMLHKGEQPIGILGFWQFSQLLASPPNQGALHGEHFILKADLIFTFPSERAIKDKSKGDGLTKTLVVGQTSWFIVQCIARWAQGLLVTELELATLAFAALNAVVYYLWWDKPVDVNVAIPVIWNSPAGDDDSVLLSDIWFQHSIFYDHLSLFSDSTRPQSSTIESPVMELPDKPAVAPSSVKRVPSSLSAREPSILPSLSSREPSIKSYTEPIWRKLRPTVNIWRKKFFEEKDDDMQVSVFNAMTRSSASDFTALCVASVVAILFGGIHCIAWGFDHTFPTPAERTLWRVCAATTTAIPVILLLRSIVRYLLELDPIPGRSGKPHFVMDLLFWILILLAPLYMIARLGLLVEACIGLRDLHPLARADLEWVNFLPHI